MNYFGHCGQGLRSVVHVVLAGDRDYTAHLLYGRNKCFLEFPSGQLIDLTLGALATASQVKFVLVIGPELLAPRIPKSICGRPTQFLKQQDSFSKNVCCALRWIQHNMPGSLAIFLTNDAPLLTNGELDHFASVVRDQNADVNIAVSRIPKEALDDELIRRYTPSIVPLSDGLYMLSNQVALSGDTVNLTRTLQELFDLRKQSQLATKLRTLCFALNNWRRVRSIASWFRIAVAKKAWLLSPTSAIYTRLSIPLQEVEATLGAMLGNSLRVRINEVPDALGCFDADTLEQFHELRKVLASYDDQKSKPNVSYA